VLQIQHDGQISTKVESSLVRENNSVYKNSDFRHRLPVRCPHEGRFAIVTERWAGDAMGAAGVRRTCAAGRNRRQRTAKSCGPGAATVASSLQGKCPAGDGGNKRRFTGESTKDTVKTIARGKPE